MSNDIGIPGCQVIAIEDSPSIQAGTPLYRVGDIGTFMWTPLPSPHHKLMAERKK